MPIKMLNFEDNEKVSKQLELIRERSRKSSQKQIEAKVKARVRNQKELKKRRDRLTDEGLCRECGKNPPLFCRTLCQACRTAARVRRQTRLLRSRGGFRDIPFQGKCDLCGKYLPRGKAVLDHCHKKVENRGWLCASCNSGLGMFKDSPETLRRAILYLESFTCSENVKVNTAQEIDDW
jgi:hypothetical protein